MKEFTFFEVCLCAFISSCISMFVYAKKQYNKQQEILNIRQEQIIAQEELLHIIWQNDSTYWNNNIVPTSEYHKLDSLKEGDWEDFYFIWNN